MSDAIANGEASFSKLFKMYSLIAHVVRAEQLTPRMRRVTLGGEALQPFSELCSPADAIKLYLPLPGQSVGSDLPKFLALPGRRKQFNIRPYTIRRFDTAALELDIDILLHGDSPGSVWARNVQAGEKVGFIGPRHDYHESPDADWLWFGGDESALPAIAALLEQLPAGKRAYAFIEVANTSDELPIEMKADVTLKWLHRGGHHDGNSLLEKALTNFTFPSGKGSFWAAGHSKAIRNMRRYLLSDRQLSKETVTMLGYWQ